MNKKVKIASLVLVVFFMFSAITASADFKYTVKSGDSMWKIAVKFQIGLSEIIKANPQIKNPALIYPMEVLTIPQINQGVLSYEQEVVRLCNNYRAQNGLRALTMDWELQRIARYKSQDMHDKNYFSHQSPTYGSPFDMMKSFGLTYRSAGENIAKGQQTPQAVVTAWMNSPGHRANILNSSYTIIGVGYVADGKYWTQEFIGR